MNDFLLWGLGVLIFLTIVAVSIGLHEAGHMIVARKLGLKVPRFFIGFGPTLFSKKFKNAEYGIKALPIGGFVEIRSEERRVGKACRARWGTRHETEKMSRR